MTWANTSTSYGSVAKILHWLTALLILTLIPIGIIANDLADIVSSPEFNGDAAMTGRAAALFSIHKTLGVTVFFVALARISWALAQPRPGLLHGNRRAGATLARTVHWLLYGSLIAVPLSGWVSHAATAGLAPIRWPFGQSLPLVPKSQGLAEWTGTLHYGLQWVLTGAIALHVAGALKHHFIDGDATLRRMLPGHVAATPTPAQPGHLRPALLAVLIWAAALGGAWAAGWFDQSSQSGETGPAALGEVQSDWKVQTGSLEISTLQLGTALSGSFDDWTASIRYAQTTAPDAPNGQVDVTILIPSLTLGSVTQQAMGPDFFAADTYPTAHFTADLMTRDGGSVARGTLTIRDRTLPVEFPFDLQIDDGTARASGTLTVDRRDYDIGLSTSDGGALGFSVDITFDLTATR